MRILQSDRSTHLNNEVLKNLKMLWYFSKNLEDLVIRYIKPIYNSN